MPPQLYVRANGGILWTPSANMGNITEVKGETQSGNVLTIQPDAVLFDILPDRKGGMAQQTCK